MYSKFPHNTSSKCPITYTSLTMLKCTKCLITYICFTMLKCTAQSFQCTASNSSTYRLVIRITYLKALSSGDRVQDMQGIELSR